MVWRPRPRTSGERTDWLVVGACDTPVLVYASLSPPRTNLILTRIMVTRVLCRKDLCNSAPHSVWPGFSSWTRSASKCRKNTLGRAGMWSLWLFPLEDEPSLGFSEGQWLFPTTSSSERVKAEATWNQCLYSRVFLEWRSTRIGWMDLFSTYMTVFLLKCHCYYEDFPGSPI